MNSKKYFIIMIFFLINCINIYCQSSNFPQIMYVVAREGLRKRAGPSINENIEGILLYGERIVVFDRSSSVETINGITAYWYRTFGQWTNTGYRWTWVFGGFLSENLPLDVPVHFGLWEEFENNRHIYLFLPNGIYRQGIKNSEWFRSGRWELNEDEFIIITEYFRNERLEIPEMENVKINIIDRNNIILTFPDGNQDNLVRSYDTGVQY